MSARWSRRGAGSSHEGGLGAGNAPDEVARPLPEALDYAGERALTARIDRKIGAHARSQAARVPVRIEAESQRHALDDLDPVAARILRRKDRELRSGARRDRADRPAPGPIRKGVDRDRRGQP